VNNRREKGGERMNNLAATLLRFAGLCMITCGAAHAIEIYPNDPVQGEQVLFSERLCQGGSPTSVETATATVGNGAIDVVFDFAGGGFAVASCGRATATSPPLAAGSFPVRYRMGFTLPPEATTVTTLQVAGATAVTPQFTGLSGNWFDPASSGTGVFLIQGETGRLFAAWFSYGPPADGNFSAQPLWLVMPAGQWITPTRYRGLVYLTSGSPINQPWDTSNLRVNPAGLMTLTFDSSRQVRFDAVTLHPNFSTFNTSSTLTRFAF
jgi:hypothetical protein